MSTKDKWSHHKTPPGYAPCTRTWPHDGPCALPPAKPSKDVAERMTYVSTAKLLAETGEVTSPPDDLFRIDDLGRMFDDLPPIPPAKPLVEMKPIQRALARRPEPSYTARPARPAITPELAADFWPALTRLQVKVDRVLRQLVIDGFDGVVDVRLFHLDGDGRTLHASVVEVDDENARIPADGTARWRINGKECRRIA